MAGNFVPDHAYQYRPDPFVEADRFVEVEESDPQESADVNGLCADPLQGSELRMGVTEAAHSNFGRPSFRIDSPNAGSQIGGLRPPSATRAQLIVCNCAHLWLFGPFCKGNFRLKMMTMVGNCGKLKTSTLSPHSRAPFRLPGPVIFKTSFTGINSFQTESSNSSYKKSKPWRLLETIMTSRQRPSRKKIILDTFFQIHFLIP